MIPAIKNKKFIKHNDNPPETLNEYIKIAKKGVRKFAHPYIASKILNDEDVISHIVYSVMEADINWNPEYVNKAGENNPKSLQQYRNQHIIWAIKKYTGHINHKSKRKIKTVNKSVYDECGIERNLVEILPNENSLSSDIESINNETINRKKDLVKELLSKSKLSKRQKTSLQLYYIEGLTLQEIANKYGVTRQAIGLAIKYGLKNIRKYCNEHLELDKVSLV